MRIRARAPVILAIVAFLYSILPFFLGIFAERYAKAFLVQENQTLGNVFGLHLSLDRYDRGWFHSTTLLKVEQKGSDGTFTLLEKIPLTIVHGPIYELNAKPIFGLAMMVANNITLDALPKYRLFFYNNVGFSNERAVLSLVASQGTDMPSVADADRLQLTMKSNLNADHFVFGLEGSGLRYQSPDHSLSMSVHDLNSTLLVDYLSDRHWQLQWRFLATKNRLAIAMPDTKTALAFGAEAINVTGLHIDTEKMAKLLSEIVQIKAADDGGQVVPPSAWITLFQQFLTQVIGNDTHVSVRDLSLTSPSGQVLLHYDASFPALPDAHDYYDVATRDVSRLMLSVPDWTYTDAPSNTEFGLTNLKVATSSNTVFARQMNVDLGAFDVKNTQSDSKIPVLYGTGLSYQNHNYGDSKIFSQVVEWQLKQLCFTEECFNNLKGQLNLLNMNFAAFRGIAAAMESVMAFDPAHAESLATKWTDLENAYIALVTPQTRVVLSHEMQTPAGNMKLYAALSWPRFVIPPSAMPNRDLFLEDMNYQVRAQFPVAYVNAFLVNEADMEKQTPKKQGEKTPIVAPTIEMQAAAIIRYAIAQKYLKQVGDLYLLDLVGVGSNATLNGIPWQTTDEGNS
ncbi:MAG: DUF945 family protein [Coxiellaceae bacterium]|nr:DUF945 family protein [Coxiellaceae bacterium]